jgi:hypothetical protein
VEEVPVQVYTYEATITQQCHGRSLWHSRSYLWQVLSVQRQVGLHRLRPVRVLVYAWCCVPAARARCGNRTAYQPLRRCHNNQRVQRPGSRRSRLPRLRRWSGLGVGGPQRTATSERTSDGGQYQWEWDYTEEEAFAQPAAAPAGTGEEVYQQVRGLVFKCEASGRVAGAMGAGTLGRTCGRCSLCNGR